MRLPGCINMLFELYLYSSDVCIIKIVAYPWTEKTLLNTLEDEVIISRDLLPQNQTCAGQVLIGSEEDLTTSADCEVSISVRRVSASDFILWM